MHIHPLENKLLIRFRVDGLLVDAFSPPISLAPAISSRLKVMTELDAPTATARRTGIRRCIGNRKIDITSRASGGVRRAAGSASPQSSVQLSLDQIRMSKEDAGTAPGPG